MSLANILSKVAAGELTPAEAEPQVIAITVDRVTCARAAMVGYLTRGVNFGNSQTLAAKCLEDADALIAAVKSTGALRSEMEQLLREVDSGAYDTTPTAHANWLARVEMVVSQLEGLKS